MTACRICTQHLEEASIAESRNVTRVLHLADVADDLGDHQLAALLRDQAVEEQLHASRLHDLASGADVDVLTGEPLRTADDVLAAAIAFARCQAEETSPWFADLAHHPGCEEVAAWFERHAEASAAQAAALEALGARTHA